MLNFDFLLRKKKFSLDTIAETKLARVLGLSDICTIGISSTIGSGIYILGLKKFGLISFLLNKNLYYT